MHVDNSSVGIHRYPIQRWMWGAFAFLFVGTLLAVVAFAPLPAGASGLGDKLNEILASILAAIVSIVGKLLLAAIYLLTLIAQYNNFIDADAVKNGWVIVRDVANMFFIVVLLIIAFATILNVSSYQWKAMLPQLLIAAILINFSKTIAGIFIDLSQVIMLTFVNGFAAAAGGNFANMFQIRGLLSLDPNTAVAVGLMQILGGYILAFVLVTIALVTTIIMAVILAFRIVMLWALVVLSPLPYLLNILPQGKKYGEKWWSMFGEYLTAGPVLAFFLWLALVSIGSGTVADSFVGGGGAGTSQSEADAVGQAIGGGIPTEAASPKSLLSFVIGICMLLAGLKITGEMSVMGAGAAKGALDKFGSIAKAGAKKFTGYRAVSERVSGVWQAREQARKEKVGDSVAAWQGRIGLVQQGIGTAMGGAGIAAGHLAFGRRAKAKDKQADDYRKQAAAARDAGDIKGAEGHEKSALVAQQDAATLRRQQRWTERGVNAGVVGVAAGLTGGAGLVLAPGLLGRGIADAGKKQREDAKQYKYKKMSGERDALKNLKAGEILKQAQGGPGVSSAEQMAAIITAVEKQLVPPGELQVMRGRLQGLKPDDKTLSTFDSIAGQKYAGTPLEGEADRPERQRRLRAGQVSMKDVPDAELTADSGSFAADIALHASPEDQKELRKSKARKAAYQAGLKTAIPTAEPKDRPKLAAELMRAGGSLSDSFGGDLDAFEAQLGEKGAGDLIAGLKPSDLSGPLIERLTRSADPAQISQAVKSVSEGGNKEDAEALRGLIDQIREQLTTATKPAIDSQAKVKTLQQSSSGAARGVSQLEGKVAQAAGSLRAARGTPQEAEMQTRLAAAQGALDAERTRQEQITRDLEAEQKNLETLKRTHAKELKKLERMKGAKNNI
ncbi:hypothetical protein HY634_01450 [Candidatus Uhrbacteria bacterium]|nr:hypothetical protein [Candidatus Uhrbacteria bacterium]